MALALHSQISAKRWLVVDTDAGRAQGGRRFWEKPGGKSLACWNHQEAPKGQQMTSGSLDLLHLVAVGRLLKVTAKEKQDLKRIYQTTKTILPILPMPVASKNKTDHSCLTA